jgi:hypothetical protein
MGNNSETRYMNEAMLKHKTNLMRNLPRILLSALAWISFFGFLWLFFLGIVERNVPNIIIMFMSFVVGLASSHDPDRETKKPTVTVIKDMNEGLKK